MKYSVKNLAKEYEKQLKTVDIEVTKPSSQIIDYSTYNEYNYRKIMKEFDTIYGYADSFDITEKFLKGE